MSKPVLYGIAGCDTMKKARRWLDARGVDYRFHDYRRHGLSRELLEPMIASLGWEDLLNRRGTTWRGLPDDIRGQLDRETVIGVMLDHPAVIKRPVLQCEERLYLGFDEARYAKIFDPA